MRNINKYIKNLQKYCNNTFKYEISNNIIKVFVDIEIYYDYDYLSHILYMWERGSKSELWHLSDAKSANLNFAMLLRNSFYYKQTEHNFSDDLEKCTNLKSLSKICSKYFNSKYYSVGYTNDNKLSIIESTSDNTYMILYTKNEKKYVIDKNSDCEYIFMRFVQEVSYYIKFLSDLKDYQKIFKEDFTAGEIINLLGY